MTEAASVAEHRQRLRELLEEVLRCDRGDLDFGVYRLMRARQTQLVEFLDNDLLPQVENALAGLMSVDRGRIKAQLREAEDAASVAGFNPDESPTVQALRAELADVVDSTTTEVVVFNHLHTFFRRYYSEGDFMPLRRIRANTYSVPYDGEEVMFHWANRDQYYVKSAESFREFRFALSDGRRVTMRVVAGETERDDLKPAKGKEGRFVLADPPTEESDDDGLSVRFEYRPIREKQKTLNEAALAQLSALSELDQWRAALMSPDARSGKPILEARLIEFTTKNTFDFFVHRDLRAFLMRELDTYVAEEVLNLAELLMASPQGLDARLVLARAVHQVATDIINVLAQFEDLQKALWLKPKLVLECEYLISLDRVPPALVRGAVSNAAQVAEWMTLYGISLDGVTSSEEAAFAFAQANPALMIDTAHLGNDWRRRFIASVEDLDRAVTGTLIQAENFQALRLLAARDGGRVNVIYIDPPYNTNSETFVYKNEYRHSSWLTMMANRLEAARELLHSEGFLLVSIDDEEAPRLKLLLDEYMGESNYVGTVVVQNNPRGRTTNTFFATSHEYYYVYARDIASARISHLALTDEQLAEFKEEDDEGSFRWLPFRRSGGLSTPDERPNSEYPIFYDAETGHMSTEQFGGAQEIWPIDTEGQRRVWRQTRPSLEKAIARGDMMVKLDGDKATVSMKDRPKAGRKPKTVWVDPKFDASTHGTNELTRLFGRTKMFSYPKSIHAVAQAVSVLAGDDPEALVADYFAGSATTADAVLRVNREDEGTRKFLLVEAGDYFDAVTVPRVKKAHYSTEWKKGEPVRAEGVSGLVRCLRLESYEDAIDNTVLTRSPEVEQSLLQFDEFRREYLTTHAALREAGESPSLVPTGSLTSPDGLVLRIRRGTKTREVAADLPETLNLLLGLSVRTDRQLGSVREICGRDRHGRSVLVLWRDLAEFTDAQLEEWFRDQNYADRDVLFDVVYVNCDSTLERLREPTQSWHVEPIDAVFAGLLQQD